MAQQTVFHRKYEMNEDCKALIKHNDQQYHNHKITHHPLMAMDLCRDSNIKRVCIDCFTDVIIRDF